MARPPRVCAFPYLGSHRYLVTACTYQRRRWFAEIESASCIASEIPEIFRSHGFDVLAYCVMPDHVHLTLEGVSEEANLKTAVGRWKQHTGYRSRASHGEHLWQPGFHDRVLREADELRAVVAYVVFNPVRAGLVDDPRDYRWTGSAKFDVADLMAFAGQWSPSWKVAHRHRRG